MNKIVILVALPCIIAVALAQFNLGQQSLGTGQQFGQYGYGHPIQSGRNVASYYNYARNSLQAAKQARQFNLLLGGLFFLNLFNFTGNRIVG